MPVLPASPRRAPAAGNGARLRRAVACLFAGAVLLAGCDALEVNPIVDTGRYYSIYGFLDTLADSQVVRVVPIRRGLSRPTTPQDPRAALDARVVLHDLDAGTFVQWQPRLVRLADGTYGHIFTRHIPRLWEGRRYRLDVIRSDGAVTSAETRVPDVTDWRKEVPREVGGRLVQTIVLEGLHAPPDSIIAFYVIGAPGQLRPPNIEVPYGEAGRPVADGWAIDLQLERDTAPHRGNAEEGQRILYQMGLRVAARDSAWTPPGGVYDPVALSHPTAFTNVQNGFGFFGVIAHFSDVWRPDDVTLQSLGFLRP